MKQDTQADQQNKKIQFQIEHLLKGFKERNKEMNQLYLSFSQMAKILAVSQDFTNKADTHMNSLSINEAIEVFEKFENKRAVGICYHNRGCLKAKLGPQHIQSALNDIMNAIGIQEEILTEAKKATQNNIEQEIKDSYIIACRYYTMGAIQHSYVMRSANDIMDLIPDQDQEYIAEATVNFLSSIDILEGDNHEEDQDDASIDYVDQEQPQ